MNTHIVIEYAKRLTRWALPLGVVLLITLAFAGISRVHAESSCTTNPEKCVSYFFREYWQTHDGLYTFGKPIGESTIHYLPGNTTYYTQLFERSILEYFPGRATPFKYGRVPVGQRWFDTYSDQLKPLTGAISFDTTKCSIIKSQRPEVCGAFLDYYQAHGLHGDDIPYVTPSEQRSLYGDPITPAMEWHQNGHIRIVQVFTHARLDYVVNDGGEPSVSLGDVVVDLLNANAPLPTTPSTPINLLYDTPFTLLDAPTLESYRKAPPASGYWHNASERIYVATSSFVYLDYFYVVWAGKGQKYITMTLLVKNERDVSQAPIYLDHSYVGLIDTDGVRYESSDMTKYLTTPFGPTTIYPGEQVAGQLIFVVPNHVAPAQIEIQLANLDQYTSRFVQVIELRVPAQQ